MQKIVEFVVENLLLLLLLIATGIYLDFKRRLSLKKIEKQINQYKEELDSRLLQLRHEFSDIVIKSTPLFDRNSLSSINHFIDEIRREFFRKLKVESKKETKDLPKYAREIHAGTRTVEFDLLRDRVFTLSIWWDHFNKRIFYISIDMIHEVFNEYSSILDQFYSTLGEIMRIAKEEGGLPEIVKQDGHRYPKMKETYNRIIFDYEALLKRGNAIKPEFRDMSFQALPDAP